MTVKIKDRSRWATRAETAYGEPLHYYASSAGEWRTDTNLDKLITDMKRSRLPFNVYRVDLPASAAYRIEMFAPVVPEDKLHWIGFFEMVED